MDKNEVIHETIKLLRTAAQGYIKYLHENSLIDSPLARMTFFTTLKQDYLEHPADDAGVQAKMVEHLDRWLESLRASMVS